METSTNIDMKMEIKEQEHIKFLSEWFLLAIVLHQSPHGHSNTNILHLETTNKDLNVRFQVLFFKEGKKNLFKKKIYYK